MVKKVALIGPMVKDSINQNGEWQGRGDRELSASLFKGLQEVYKDSKVQFSYAKGCTLTATTAADIAKAVAIARAADVAVVALGEDYNWSSQRFGLRQGGLSTPIAVKRVFSLIKALRQI